MKYNFKKKSTLENRINESNKILKKYPDRVPVIVEKHHDSDINDIDKSKYLVPKDMTMGQFLFVVRKRIKLGPEQALFITVNSTLVSSVKTIADFCSNL